MLPLGRRHLQKMMMTVEMAIVAVAEEDDALRTGVL